MNPTSRSVPLLLCLLHSLLTALDFLTALHPRSLHRWIYRELYDRPHPRRARRLA